MILEQGLTIAKKEKEERFMTNLHPIWNGERLPMSLTIDSSSLVRHWSYQDGLKENDLHYLSAKKNGFINNLIVTCEV